MQNNDYDPLVKFKSSKRCNVQHAYARCTYCLRFWLISSASSARLQKLRMQAIRIAAISPDDLCVQYVIIGPQHQHFLIIISKVNRDGKKRATVYLYRISNNHMFGPEFQNQTDFRYDEGYTYSEDQKKFAKLIEHLSAAADEILLKYLFFFSRSDFFKKISRTHQIFQENQKWYKNTYKFSRRGKMYQNTSKFSEELSQNCARTHTIFQEEEIP